MQGYLNEDVKRHREEILAQHIEQMKSELARRPPSDLALKAGVPYDPSSQEFKVEVFGRAYLVHYPDFEIIEAENQTPAGVRPQALILYYLRTATGAPMAGRWISFRELSDGMNYAKAFQGYSGDALVSALDGNLARFKGAAEALGALPQPMADAAYSVWALPKVSLAVLLWDGAEGFPARIQVLFDASASHYLPTDILASLGADLCRIFQAADSGGGGA